MLARILLLFGLLLAMPVLSAAPAWAQSTPTRAEAEELFLLGYGHFKELRLPEARAAFEGALRLDPDHQQARSYLIECLVLDGDLEAARAVAVAPSEAGPEPVTEPEPQPIPEPGPLVVPLSEPVEPPRQAAVVQIDEHAVRAAARAAREAKKERRNPRRGEHFGIGLGLGGPAATVGLFAEVRPGWLGSGVFGIGSFLVARDDRIQAAAAVSAELQLSPVPWRLTPLLGVGVVGFAGPGASAIDAALASPGTGRSNVRVVPYGLLGARYDFRKTLWLSVCVRLAPSPSLVVMPIPGARLGLRF